MEEQNESKKNAAGNSCAQSDRRTFLIAFLTAVIVLAVYHFGTGVFAIFAGKSDYCTIPVTREYVLVPVSSMPEPHMGMRGRGHGGGFHHGGFHRGGHGGEHGGMPGRRGEGMGHHGGEHGHHPDPAAPVPPVPADPAAPAVEQPANAE